LRSTPDVPRIATIFIVLTLLILSSLTMVDAIGARQRSTTSTTSSTSTGGSSLFSRVVLARAYQQHNWTLPGVTVTQVANTLASLGPTYVSGLIRLDGQLHLTTKMIQNYNLIRNAVLSKSPNAKFDFTLNPVEYNNSQQLITKMAGINALIHVDIWFFDFYDQAYNTNSTMVTAAIQYAHSHGQLIGGNVGQARSESPFPPGSDFVAAPDSNFSVPLHTLKVVRQQSATIPILVHINNNPQQGPTTESCVYINGYTYQQRVKYETGMAKNQTTYGFTFMYNVFFPQCPSNISYNVLADGSMLQVVQTLLNKYN
jgi:hypothetical protein